MTIVKYVNSHNIDVQFDDAIGTIYKHKKLTDFYKGKISNPNKYVGLENTNTHGYKMKVLTGNTCNLTVEFEDGVIVNNIRKENFDKGMVKNPCTKTVYNVGWIGIGKYKSTDAHGKSTVAYSMWHKMLERCCSDKLKVKWPTYLECNVSDYFKCFQNFAQWYEDNIWCDENLDIALDKDILIKGNKLYSENTCVIVTREINNLFTSSAKRNRGPYPLGVSLHKGRFESSYRGKFIGCFNNPIEAFNAYKKFKESYIKRVADEYKNKYPNFPQKLYDAMYNYQVEITD